MNRKKIEAEQRAKWFLILTWARIIAQITMIIGFFIIVYFLVRGFL